MKQLLLPFTRTEKEMNAICLCSSAGCISCSSPQTQHVGVPYWVDNSDGTPRWLYQDVICKICDEAWSEVMWDD